MDHTRAIEVQAAERYLLGELPADEAEDFERHFFECEECAQAVESGGQFIANAKAVFTEGNIDPAPERAPSKSQESFQARLRGWWSWPQWVPVAAALVLGVVALYQGFVVIPGMRQTLESARALPAFQLAGLSRGADTALTVPAGTPSVALSIDVPPNTQFPKFHCALISGGRTVFQLTAPPPAEGQPITILTPTRNLSAGDYELSVYGVDADGQQRDKVTNSQFKLQFK